MMMMMMPILINTNNIWDGEDGEIKLGMGFYISQLSLLPWVLIDEEIIWMWILNTKTNSHNGWLVMEPIYHPHGFFPLSPSLLLGY